MNNLLDQDVDDPVVSTTESKDVPVSQPKATTKPAAKPAVKAALNLKAKAIASGVNQKVSTEPKTVKIQVRKPKQYEWVRVHPDTVNYSIILAAIVFGDEDAAEVEAGKIEKAPVYAVHPDLVDHPDLEEDAVRRKEYNLAITRKGKLFLWEHSVLDKANSWVDAEEDNIAVARKTWIRQISNQADSTYNRREAKKSFGEPQWPADLTQNGFEEMLVEGLGDLFVTSESHPIFGKIVGS
jgi:hypothetical protein